MVRFGIANNFRSPPFLKHLLAEPRKMEDAVKHLSSIKQLTCFLLFRLGSSWFGCKLHAAGLGLGSISQALFVWSLNHDVDFVKFCDVDGRLTRREFVCAVVLQKLATPPEAGTEDVMIWAEPFCSLTRHLYFLKCYAMVNLVQDWEHKMRKANSWVLTGFFTRLRVPFLERQSKVSASRCLRMVFGILTLKCLPQVESLWSISRWGLFHCDSIKCISQACVATLTTRPRQLHEAYGGQSIMGNVYMASLRWKSMPWSQACKSFLQLWFHLVSPVCFDGNLTSLTCCTHMPGGCTWLLPVLKIFQCQKASVGYSQVTCKTMYAFLPVYMLVCLRAFIYPPTYPSMWLLTYLPSTYPFASNLLRCFFV